VDGGGGDHGGSTQDVAVGGGAVSSGEFFDGGRAEVVGEFLEDVTTMGVVQCGSEVICDYFRT